MKGYRISVLRHGMTEANEKGVYIGSTDLPLSDKGAAELAAKADEYDYPRVHRVYSSPLRRCTETAEILFPDTELCTVDDLRELNFGEFENKSIDELAKRKDYNDWLRGGKDARPPKGESLEDTELYQWMSAHCQEYGFIVRFPKGKEDVTGIIYEPWHFRYVGIEAATYIMENDLTLEEFLELYK